MPAPACLLHRILGHLTTRFFLYGAIIAPTSWARVVQTSPAAVASLLPCQALRPIAFLTSNSVQCISPITLRRRISRCGCMRIIPISGLTSSSARSSPAATNCMSRVYRARVGRLLRTSAMLARQRQARAPIPVRVAERPRPQRHLLPLRQRRPLL